MGNLTIQDKHIQKQDLYSDLLLTVRKLGTNKGVGKQKYDEPCYM